jgi:glycerate kinase
MPLRLLIAPDKFKGTLSARAAAEAIARGWRSVRPDDDLALVPMSDGGDGFGEILADLLDAVPVPLHTVDAAHRPLDAAWWLHEATRTALIESARIIGLALLPAKRFHPFELDTRGLGAAFRAAAKRGARRCLVGIGGSATNDAGFVAARALGWRFFGETGDELTSWTQLHRLSVVRPPSEPPQFDELVVAVDVQNPLLGTGGCTRIYGPQKGLRPEDFDLAERCLDRLAVILRQQCARDHAAEPGAGAAGGLGFGLRSFAGARLEPGFGLFARYAGLEQRLAGVDAVITGEGAIDAQTLMGKGVGELALLCQRAGLPCLALAGAAQPGVEPERLFAATHLLTPDFVSPQRAFAETAACLEELAAHAARQWVTPKTSPPPEIGEATGPSCSSTVGRETPVSRLHSFGPSITWPANCFFCSLTSNVP